MTGIALSGLRRVFAFGYSEDTFWYDRYNLHRRSSARCPGTPGGVWTCCSSTAEGSGSVDPTPGNPFFSDIDALLDGAR